MSFKPPSKDKMETGRTPNVSTSGEPQQAEQNLTKEVLQQEFWRESLTKLLQELEGKRVSNLDIQASVFAKAMAYANNQSSGCTGRVTFDDGMAIVMGTIRALTESVTQTFSATIVQKPIGAKSSEDAVAYATSLELQAVSPLGLSEKTRGLFKTPHDASIVSSAAAAVKSAAEAVSAIAPSSTKSVPKAAKSRKSSSSEKTKVVFSTKTKEGSAKQTSSRESKSKGAVPLSDEDKARRKFLQACRRSAKSKDWAAVLSFYKKTDADIESAVKALPLKFFKEKNSSLPPLERLGLVNLLTPLPAGAKWSDAEDINDLVASLVKRAEARFLATQVTWSPVSKEVFIQTYKDLQLSAPKTFRDAVLSTRAHLKKSLGLRDEPLVSLRYLKDTGDRSLYRATWGGEGKGQDRVFTIIAFLRSSMRSGPSVEVVDDKAIPLSSFIPNSALQSTDLGAAAKAAAPDQNG